MFDEIIPWAPIGFARTLVSMSKRALSLQVDICPRCKPDGTLVTSADTSLEELLSSFLETAEPESYVLGEETMNEKPTSYLHDAIQGRTWVIDPIDGTLLYCMRMPGWGISIGLMENAILAHGVVAFPFRGPGMEAVEILYSNNGQVMMSEARIDASMELAIEQLQKNARPMTLLPSIDGFPGVLAISQRVAKKSLYMGSQPIISTGSCVSTFKYLMQGSVSAYMIRMKLWDIAASWPLAYMTGIRGVLQGGHSFDLSLDPAVWDLDPKSKTFLELKEHGMFYRPERATPSWWNDSVWPIS